MTLNKITRYFQYIGLLLLILILLRIDLPKSLILISNASAFDVFVAYLFALLSVFLKSGRWNYLLRHQDVKLSIWTTYHVYLWSFFYGVVTPGRIGEAVKAIYVKEYFDSFGDAVASVFTDRWIDIQVLILSCMVMLGLFGWRLEITIWLYVFGCSLLIAPILVWLLCRRHKARLEKLIAFMIPGNYRSGLLANMERFYENVFAAATSVRVLSVTMILTALALLCHGVIGWFVLKAIGVNIDYSYVLFCSVIAKFVSMLPISISGLGSRELAMIYLFSIVNVTEEVAVIYSLSLFMVSVVLAVHGCVINFIIPKYAKSIVSKTTWRS